MTNKIISFDEAKKNIQKNVNMRRKNLPEIEILRSIAMLAVIAIHVLNIPVSQLLTGSVSHGRFFMARAMLIFAVPCFLFLSMLMVGYGDNHFDAKFYQKKLLRIGVPYLLWSILYLIIVFTVNQKIPENFFSVKSIFYYLAYGKAYEHLYFMPILLGFYVVAPLMKKLAMSVKNNPIAAIAIALVSQAAVYALNRFVLYPEYTMLSSTFLWYFSMGFLGLWFGLDYTRNFAWVKKHSNKIFLLLVLSSAVHQYYQRILWQQLWNDIKFNTFFYTMNLHGYFLLATFALLILSAWLVRFPQNQKGVERKSYRLLKELSPYSYGIYLMHPIFTFLLRKFVVTSSAILWATIVPVSVISLALLCGWITKKVQNLPVIRFAFGK